AHYLLYGRRHGLSPHPLFIPEYFDSRNWRDSIIDPLTRYIIDRKNWSLPTCIIFNPSYIDLQTKLPLPPLAVFSRRFNDSSVLPIDTDYHDDTQYTWRDVGGSIFESIATYREQEETRGLSRPVNSFD